MAVLEILCKFKTWHTLKASFSGLISSINSRDRTFFLSCYEKKKKLRDGKIANFYNFQGSKEEIGCELSLRRISSLWWILSEEKKIVYLSQTMSHMPVANEQSSQKKQN